MTTLIEHERTGRVATVTLNRPRRRNALGTEMIQGLDYILTELDYDSGVGAIVLTGAAPSFCAGSDMKELGTLDVVGMARHEAVSAAVARRIALMDTPVIAAVEGFAFGGGFILAACCDLVVTAENATWNLAEVPNGWLPPWGLKALVARTGAVTARRLTWGHERLDGASAYRLGVADYCAPEDQALSRAMELANGIAALPTHAVASTKQFFQQLIAGEAEVYDSTASRIFIDNCAYDEARATLAKFGGKA